MPNIVTHACKLFTGDAKIFVDVSIQIESSKRILTILVCRGSYLSTKVNANISISVVLILWKIIHMMYILWKIGKLIKNWNSINIQWQRLKWYWTITPLMTGYPVIHSVQAFRGNAILPKIFPRAHNTKSLVPNDPIHVSPTLSFVVPEMDIIRFSSLWKIKRKIKGKKPLHKPSWVTRLVQDCLLQLCSGRTLQITGKAV